jgi:hypothetical protein
MSPVSALASAPLTLAAHREAGAGDAREQLERAGQVELGQAGEQQHADLQGRWVRHGQTVADAALARMTIIMHILPMPQRPPRRVVLIAVPGAQSLDVTGPLEAFAGANQQLAAPGYRLVVASPGGGTIAASSGLAFATVGLATVRPPRATPCWWPAPTSAACARRSPTAG